MSAIDWVIVVAYLVWMIYDGLRRSEKTDEMEGYFLASRSLPWWAVGLSVMATQLSAITLVGTTGQAAVDGDRFARDPAAQIGAQEHDRIGYFFHFEHAFQRGRITGFVIYLAIVGTAAIIWGW